MASLNCVGLSLWGRQKLSLHYRNSKVRQRRFVMGRGSVTLSRLLMDDKLQRNKWTDHVLLKAAQVMGAGTGPTKTLFLDQSCEESSYL